MKTFKSLALLGMIMPVMMLATEPTNAELYEMFKQLEHKLDVAIADGNKAKAEAALAKKEAASAKAELARLKKGYTMQPVVAATESTTTVASKTPISVHIEPLMLRTTRNGLDYAILDINNNGEPEGNIISVNPGYDTGVRLGANYEIGSGKDIFADLATLKVKQSSSVSTEISNNLWGIWLHPNAIIDDNDVDEASAAYDLDYMVFDLGMSKRFGLGKGLGARLKGGLRYAKINQTFDIDYVQHVTSTLDRIADVHIDNKFKGFGPRIGLDMDWDMGHGFGLFGSVTGSLLTGDFKLGMQEIDTTTSGSTTTQVDITETSKHRMIPVVDMRLGLGYIYPINEDMIFTASVGYEWQNWSNMVSARRFNDDVDGQISSTETNNLAFDGFFFRSELKF